MKDILSTDTIISKLTMALPTIFARKEIPKLTGQSISSGTLANLASEGYGPPCTTKGRNAIYERDSFLEWFKVYLKGGVKAVKEAYSEKDKL